MQNHSSVRAAFGLVTVLALHAGSVNALDLPTTLRDVAAGNPDVAARAAMVEAARWRAEGTGRWSSPMLELGLVNVPTSGKLDEDPMTMRMVGLSQRVALSGAPGLARRAARSHVSADSAAREQTLSVVLALALEHYAEAYYARQRFDLAVAHAAAIDRLVESARARYQSGRGRLDDVLQAESERARLIADRVTFQAEARTARVRLDALRGVATDWNDTLATPQLPAPGPSPDPWLAAVGPGHPRLRQLDARMQGYQLGAASARRSVWPDLELRGSYGFREPLAGLHTPQPQDDMFSVEVGLMLPLYGAGREGAEGREMDAMARAIAAESRAAQLELRRDILDAWEAANAGERVVSLLADTVLVSRQQAVEAAWAAYGTAHIDLWRAMESTHAVYREAVELTRARETLMRSKARLVAASSRVEGLGLEWPREGGPR